MAKKRFTKREAALKHGFKSGLEETVSKNLADKSVNGEYEKHTIKYIIPATNHIYTPDFKLPNGIFIETKGRFVIEDRKKHLYIREQHPNIDIRFVFQNSKNKIRKGSKTTYADWCVKYGFLYADKSIPDSWLI